MPINHKKTNCGFEEILVKNDHFIYTTAKQNLF